MKASDRLLALENKRLMVFKDFNNNICVHYEDSYVKDGVVLRGITGRASDFEYACEDYLRQISGKTLVFNAFSNAREEVRVL